MAVGQWRAMLVGGRVRNVHCELTGDGLFRATVYLPADNEFGVRYVRGESRDGLLAAIGALEDALAQQALPEGGERAE
jgi:hypothetical protein